MTRRSSGLELRLGTRRECQSLLGRWGLRSLEHQPWFQSSGRRHDFLETCSVSA